MKKITSYLALAAVAMAFTACSDDTEPKADYPTNHDFLNIPVMANQTIVLETAGSVDFTLSQLDYGVAIVPDYALQISLDPSFEKLPSEIASVAPIVYSTEKESAYYQLPVSSQSVSFAASAKDIADGISAMLGYDDIEQYKGREDKCYTGPLYCRVLSTIPTANPGTYDKYSILSNVVTLATVIGYPTVRQPGWIYLVGAPEGWVGPTPANAEHYKDWMLFESKDGIDSKIYCGTFDIPAGKFQFRFYTLLDNWEDNSWGPQKDDAPVAIKMTDGVFSGDIMEGKGSFDIADWAGGWVKMTVNLKAKNVTFKAVSGPDAE